MALQRGGGGEGGGVVTDGDAGFVVGHFTDLLLQLPPLALKLCHQTGNVLLGEDRAKERESGGEREREGERERREREREREKEREREGEREREKERERAVKNMNK